MRAVNCIERRDNFIAVEGASSWITKCERAVARARVRPSVCVKGKTSVRSLWSSWSFRIRGQGTIARINIWRDPLTNMRLTPLLWVFWVDLVLSQPHGRAGPVQALLYLQCSRAPQSQYYHEGRTRQRRRTRESLLRVPTSKQRVQ